MGFPEEAPMKNRTLAIALGTILAGLAALGLDVLEARQTQTAPSVKRNVLLKQDMTIPGREAVMASVELPPGSAEVRHTHPAEVYGFDLLLLRPDMHVVWRGNATPDNTGEVARIATGH